MSVHLDPSFKSYLHKSFPKIQDKGIQAVLEMSSEGATVPFMARYRKEKTDNLDEVEIRGILDSFETWTEVVKRKSFVVAEIAKQGNLTEALKKRIEASWDLAEVEELYRPFKRKKKTKATLAREAGLEPFAHWIWAIGHGESSENVSLEIKAKEYLNPLAGYATYDEVLRGVQHIIVERLNNDIDLREKVRTEYMSSGVVTSEKTAKYKAHSKFEMYSSFREAVKSLLQAKASHRYLALRRGWQEEELKVGIEADDAKLLLDFERAAVTVADCIAHSFLKESAKVALHVHVIPSIVNEIHRIMKEKADSDAILVFSENLRKVLMASPFGPKVVLGVDPGLRTGCKLALLDKSGAYISSTVLQIHGEGAEANANKLFSEVLKQVKIEAIAVGNGTGGREAEMFIRKILKEIGSEVPVVMVNESGASVYSASEIARTEFPELDITVRGAISIARRLQDPLAELVKIDPKSIGVGQYQHDVGQGQLKKSLHDVVESCVNHVGIDLNTASESLLQYVSGIGPGLAKSIVEYRKSNGLFQDRQDLMKVSRFTTKGFEQAAGFLRIQGGKVFLDETGIHPESYQAVKDMAHELGLTPRQLAGEGAAQVDKIREKWSQLLGEFTFNDILQELKKPGRDPRDAFKVFQFREDVHEVADLKEGMICPGIVTNVTNFGAFVDIGVHQDGLVHISQLAHNFVDDPRKVVTPGDQVKVKVLGVDKDKNQISLTMLLEERQERVPNLESRAGSRGKEGGKARSGIRRAGASAPARVDQGGNRPSLAKEARGSNKPQRDPHKGNRRDNNSRDNNRPRRQPAQPFNNPFAALGNPKRSN